MLEEIYKTIEIFFIGAGIGTIVALLIIFNNFLQNRKERKNENN